MNIDRRKWLLLAVALVLIGGTAGWLARQRAQQKLGAPGVKTHPLAGSKNLEVELPERVLDYESQWVPVDQVTKSTLPADTSFGERIYTAPDGFRLAMQVVLMGTDRTSLHKPQFCLAGQGLRVDESASAAGRIQVDRPDPYELPVVKLVANGEQTSSDGQKQFMRAIYVYWYVADDALSATVYGFERMWLMSKRLISTGVLQRWAYVSALAYCLPGQEDATFERMKKFIATSVPEFQLYPKPAVPSMTAATP